MAGGLQSTGNCHVSVSPQTTGNLYWKTGAGKAARAFV